MAVLHNSSKRLNKIADRIPINVEKTVRRVALAVDATLVLATPVDTGRARSNWQVTLDDQPSESRPPFSEGEKGSTAAKNAREAIEEGKRVIKNYKLGDTIHITNNLSYIGKLNNGSSAQAPAGFVEKAILVGIDTAKASKITTVTEGEA